MKCPICKKDAALGDEFFPFCSERCKIIDLEIGPAKNTSSPRPFSRPVLTTSHKTMSLSPPPKQRIDGAFLIATWFGCGLVPVGPGTAGSLAALVIAIALHQLDGSGNGTFLLLAGALLVPGIWAASVVAQRSGIKDPQIVVVDEVLGQWLTLAGVSTLNWKSWMAAFILFRIFDIWKPPPARRAEALPGGIGIVADDLIAGLYGAIAIFVLDRFRLF